MIAARAITDFAAPAERVQLRSAALQLELWPELGGAIAAFAWHAAAGRRVPLFRETGKQGRYTPMDHLASWPLLPYSNRIRAGRFMHQGRQHHLPVNYAGCSHPLHGIGWLSRWQVEIAEPQRCTLALVHAGDEHWPYAFTARQQFALQELSLHVNLSLCNDALSAMPCGLGQHPYVSCPAGTRITAPVRGVWLTDQDTLPHEYQSPPLQWDLRAGCLLDGRFVDNCFDGLDGAIDVQWPGGGRLSIDGSPNLRFLVIYHPIGGDFVCLEAVSHMPDAFNRPEPAEATGLASLAPGATLSVTHRYTYHPA